MGLKPTLPNSEVGVVQDLIGTAYDNIKLIADNLSKIDLVASNIIEANADITIELDNLTQEMGDLRVELLQEIATAKCTLGQLIKAFKDELTEQYNTIDATVLNLITQVDTLLDRIIDVENSSLSNTVSISNIIQSISVIQADLTTLTDNNFTVEDGALVIADLNALTTSVNSLYTSLNQATTTTSQAIATLTSRVEVTENGLSNVTDSNLQLRSDLDDTILNLGAESLARQNLSTRIDLTEDSINTLSQNLITLSNTLDVESGKIVAQNQATDLLNSRITATEGNLVSVNEAITTLENDVIFNAGNINTVANATNALSTSITDINDVITVQAQEVTNLDVNYTNLSQEVTANSAATDLLLVGIQEIENGLISYSQRITDLESSISPIPDFDANEVYEIDDVFKYDGNYYVVVAEQTPPNATPPNETYYLEDNSYADLATTVAGHSTLLDTLSTDVSLINGELTALSEFKTEAETTIGQNSATLTQLGQTVDGIEARWEVKSDVNGLESGVGFYNDGTDVVFGITLDGVYGLKYNVTDNVMEYRGKLVIASGSSGYSNMSDKPTTLAHISITESNHLSGIQPGATVGAPPGTLVNGVPVANITDAVANFNSNNDRNGSAIVAPIIATNGTAIDHTLQANGSADISFEWTWNGNENDIDGFIVYIRSSSSSASYIFGTFPSQETTYTVPADKRAMFFYGLTPTDYYTFGVRAYRIVDSDVSASGVIRSTLVKATGSGENPYRPSSQIAFDGNLTGTVGNIPVAYVNDWDHLDGIPPRIQDTPSNGLNLTETHLGYYFNGDWGSYMDNNGNFYLNGDSNGPNDENNYLQWNGSTLTVRGNIQASSVTAGAIDGETITGGNFRTDLPGTERIIIRSATNALEGYWNDGSTYSKWIQIGRLSSAFPDAHAGNYAITLGGTNFLDGCLVGQTRGTTGIEIINTNTTSNHRAVTGRANSSFGTGVVGISSYGTGTFGSTSNGYGVRGAASFGVAIHANADVYNSTAVPLKLNSANNGAGILNFSATTIALIAKTELSAYSPTYANAPGLVVAPFSVLADINNTPLFQVGLNTGTSNILGVITRVMSLSLTDPESVFYPFIDASQGRDWNDHIPSGTINDWLVCFIATDGIIKAQVRLGYPFGNGTRMRVSTDTGSKGKLVPSTDENLVVGRSLETSLSGTKSEIFIKLGM